MQGWSKLRFELWVVVALLVVSSAFANEVVVPVQARTVSGNGSATFTIQDFTRTVNCNDNNNLYDSFDIDANYTSGPDDVFDAIVGLNESIKQVCTQYMWKVNQSIDNLSSNCGFIVNNYKGVFDYYNPYLSCVVNLTSCNDKAEGLTERAKERDNFSSALDSCKTDKLNVEGVRVQLSTDLTSQRDLNVKCEAAKKKESDNKWLFLFGGALAGYGIFYWQKKRAEPKSPASKEQMPQY